MKGGIFSDERCPICNGRYRHFEPKGLWCPEHPQYRPTTFVVRFGKITKRKHSYKGATRFLTGLRFKTDEGTFDVRDYQKNKPLGFARF